MWVNIDEKNMLLFVFPWFIRRWKFVMYQFGFPKKRTCALISSYRKEPSGILCTIFQPSGRAAPGPVMSSWSTQPNVLRSALNTTNVTWTCTALEKSCMSTPKHHQEAEWWWSQYLWSDQFQLQFPGYNLEDLLGNWILSCLECRAEPHF